MPSDLRSPMSVELTRALLFIIVSISTSLLLQHLFLKYQRQETYPAIINTTIMRIMIAAYPFFESDPEVWGVESVGAVGSTFDGEIEMH
jgi:hypothetical protein